MRSVEPSETMRISQPFVGVEGVVEEVVEEVLEDVVLCVPFGVEDVVGLRCFRFAVEELLLLEEDGEVE